MLEKKRVGDYLRPKFRHPRGLLVSALGIASPVFILIFICRDLIAARFREPSAWWFLKSFLEDGRLSVEGLSSFVTLILYILVFLSRPIRKLPVCTKRERVTRKIRDLATREPVRIVANSADDLLGEEGLLMPFVS